MPEEIMVEGTRCISLMKKHLPHWQMIGMIATFGPTALGAAPTLIHVYGEVQ